MRTGPTSAPRSPPCGPRGSCPFPTPEQTAIILRIRGRAGRTYATYLQPRTYYDDEFEVLLPRGTSFRVVGVINDDTYEDGARMMEIEVEVVQDDSVIGGGRGSP